MRDEKEANFKFCADFVRDGDHARFVHSRIVRGERPGVGLQPAD